MHLLNQLLILLQQPRCRFYPNTNRSVMLLGQLVQNLPCFTRQARLRQKLRQLHEGTLCFGYGAIADGIA